MADEQSIPLAEVARRTGVTAATLKRWVKAGIVPQPNGRWTPASVAHARLVARLRDRGYSLDAIKSAGDSGRLAFSYIEDLLPAATASHSLEEAAELAGVEPALAERVLLTMGYSAQALDRLSDDDCALLSYVGSVLAAGFPLVAFIQLARVYGHALAQIADAEVRLFHLYVHEPLMRDGVPGLEMAEEMEELARELLPVAAPMMNHIHLHFLHHFVEQDVVGHMEADIGDQGLDLGRLRVAIAFADLAGYTKMTEEQGDEEAVGAVERFMEAVEHTLPDDARVIKTIGDEVMVVSPDPASLTDWAVGFQELHGQRPLPRIGIHYGETIYRDGDYYGRAVNQAARVAARAAGGEVLVTRAVVEMAGDHLEFELIGEVRLKGFADPTEIFLARLVDED